MTATELPEPVATHPLRDKEAWIAHRDSGLTPRDASEMTTTQEARDEFLTGAWLLNATTRTGLLNNVTPQMLQAVDVLNAAMLAQTLISAILMPRRSGKTTVLFCVLLGRCYLRPVHFAGFALLTTQKKTSERYRLDIYGPIIRQWPNKDTRPVTVIRSNGNERIEFPNGSNLAVLSPEGDAVRSGAYDTLLLDEGGEATIDRWEDIIGAVVPSFDTRPDGQIVIAGTAGDYRDGSEFWKALNDPRAGRLNFSIPDDIDPEALDRWEPDDEHPYARAGSLIQQVHPGIGNLTTLERIHQNYDLLGPKKFTREYFNLFGAEGSNTALLDQRAWHDAARPLAKAGTTVPRVFVLVAYVHPDATSASIGAAWWGPKRKTIRVGLLHHQTGVDGYRKKLLTLARRHKRAIVYDPFSAATSAEIVALREARPAPAEKPVIMRDVTRAAVNFANLLNQGGIEHFDQPQLTTAAEIAVKRPIGSAWGFGRPDVKNRPTDDITPLEAVAIAAYLLPQTPATSKPSIDFFE